MQWEVTGADRQTGQERRVLIDADDEASARRRANRRGVLVSEARPIDPDDSVAGAIATRVQAVPVPPPMPMPPQPQVVYVMQQPPQQHHAPYQQGVVTIQATGKFWKGQMALAALGAIACVVILGLALNKMIPDMPWIAVGILGLLVSLIWYVFARIGAWWCHG